MAEEGGLPGRAGEQKMLDIPNQARPPEYVYTTARGLRLIPETRANNTK